MKDSSSIGFEVRIAKSYEEALESVVAALKVEGFGVLTRIDVKQTLKDKLDVEFRPYTILGACNPTLSYRALSREPIVGLLLPCNITVEEDGKDNSIVRIANPEVLLDVGSLFEIEDLRGVATEAKERLERVAEAIA